MYIIAITITLSIFIHFIIINMQEKTIIYYLITTLIGIIFNQSYRNIIGVEILTYQKQFHFISQDYFEHNKNNISLMFVLMNFF